MSDTAQKTHAYLECRRLVTSPTNFDSNQASADYQSDITDTWDNIVTCIKANNTVIECCKSYLLTKRVILGFLMKKGADLFKDEKLLGKVEGTFEQWIHKNIILSSQYTRKLKAISRVIYHYPKICKLYMSVSDAYKRLSDIRKMLEV